MFKARVSQSNESFACLRVLDNNGCDNLWKVRSVDERNRGENLRL